MEIAYSTTDTKSNEHYDTANLRFHADYDIEVADGVFWVPVNTLGTTRYSNDDIKEMLTLSPEKKQRNIRTLYEAIQLYQMSKFRGIIDNIDCVVDDGKWEFKKPGYHSVRTNEGCCSSNSNWLAYLLKGKYEKTGFFNYMQRDTSGHVTNYIFHNGWYYFIDMMMYRADSLPYAGIETGTALGYKDGQYISGNLHRTRNPKLFVDYCLQNFINKPVIFIMLQQNELESIGVRARIDGGIAGKTDEEIYNKILENGYDLIYPNNSSIIYSYKADSCAVGLSFHEPPACSLNWDDLASDLFMSNQ